MKDGIVLESTVKPEIIDKIMHLEMKKGDVLIATYPKTGKFFICVRASLGVLQKLFVVGVIVVVV